MGKYANCRHQWEVRYLGSPAAIRCSECGLQVEIFSDHVSLYDFTKGENFYLGHLDYPPDPEDEEETQLEPEEVTADAEGGREV